MIKESKKFGIAIHGGAGTIVRELLTPEREQAYLAALEQALNTSYTLLEKGGSAMDAVEKAVRSLEDSPLFNAGRGSVFTADGTHEMDASIMDGATRQAGAAAGVTGVRNPIMLARHIMEHSSHIILAGQGAERFAKQQGLQFEAEEYFFVKQRYDQWQQVKGSDTTALDHSEDRKFGTVGAVALDVHGNMAAATSTGGMTNKQFGRVGDSPIIGAGTWADNNTCAISCTGDGEYFIRAVAAYDVACLMEYKGLSLEAACDEVVMNKLRTAGGEGGLIGIDKEGSIVLCFNTLGMYRGMRDSSGQQKTAIFK